MKVKLFEFTFPEDLEDQMSEWVDQYSVDINR